LGSDTECRCGSRAWRISQPNRYLSTLLAALVPPEVVRRMLKRVAAAVGEGSSAVRSVHVYLALDA
jgi:hypothetical protein